MIVFRPLTILLLVCFALPAAAQNTSQGTETSETLPDMATIEAAYNNEDFDFAREGLAQLAQQTGTAIAQYRYGLILLEGRGGPRDAMAAADWLQRAVDQDHIAAATMLARLYLSGGDVPRDPARAAALLQRSAARGDTEGQYYLALLYRSGEGLAQDNAQSLNWFLAAAENQHTEAAYELSRAYSRGLGTPEDPVRALRWLTQAAEAGHTQAQFFLANAYDTGGGVGQNRNVALDWYRQAALGGHPLSQRILGTRYLQGEGVYKDIDEALRLLHLAAKADEPGALYNLGHLYADGTDVEQDDEKAAEWYTRAAATGLPRAILMLATLYETGRGVAQDTDRAIELYIESGLSEAQARLGHLAGQGALDGRVAPQQAVPWSAIAAAAGDSDALDWLAAQAKAGVRVAQTQLGVFYLDRDERLDEAVVLLTQAAEMDDPQAQLHLGELYTTGTGVEQDYVQAHKWLNVAAALGQPQAAETREIVTALMTPEQVAEAQTQARIHFDSAADRAPQTNQTIRVQD